VRVKGHCNILFLCIGNPVRFIAAKAILNIRGRPNFIGYNIGRRMTPAGYK
jgi:protein-tyrosine-phosphatase